MTIVWLAIAYIGLCNMMLLWPIIFIGDLVGFQQFTLPTPQQWVLVLLTGATAITSNVCAYFNTEILLSKKH